MYLFAKYSNGFLFKCTYIAVVMYVQSLLVAGVLTIDAGLYWNSSW